MRATGSVSTIGAQLSSLGDPSAETATDCAHNVELPDGHVLPAGSA
jgi:hypothetical protein